MPQVFVHFRRLLFQPSQVFVFCLVFALFNVVVKGSLWRLYSLNRDYSRLEATIASTQLAVNQLQASLKQARDPSFIERQARDRLDLVDEHDLVFVFADQ